MGKTVKIENIQGGTAPYEVELIPVGVQSATSFNDVPTGVFRVKVIDSEDTTTLPKVVSVVDPNHVTDRRINWDKIPAFSLPASLTAIWGGGCPRWLDEASPTDAMVRGWTATDNNNLDGAELADSKRQKSIYFPFGGASALYDAIQQTKAAHPSVINAAIIQEYTVINTTNAIVDFTYTDFKGDTINASIPAAENGSEQITVACLYYTQPSYGVANQGIIRIYNPDGVTEAGYIALGRAYYNQEKHAPDGITGNPTLRKAGIIFYNEETLGNAGRANQLLFKGMGLEAVAQGSPLKIVYYGKEFVGWGGGFYSGQQNDAVGWKQKIFPNLSAAIKITAEQFTEYADLTALGDANCVILNSGTYFKVPYPSGVKYEKQNGAFVIDQDGERKWRLGNFSEQIRGQNITFLADTQNGGWIGADPSYGYPNNRVPEVFWAVWQMYSALSFTIFVNIAIAKKYRGNTDIYTQMSDLPVKNGVVMRNVTEGTAPAYSDVSRPITTFQAEWSILTSFALTEFYEVWSDYVNVRHPNESYPPVATNKGAGYGNQFLQMSEFEDLTWALKFISHIAQSGVFDTGNKKIIAYQPANTTNEIQILGRVKSNKIWVFACEPRLDPSEKILVTMSNKKNTYTQAFEVKHNENFSNVFTLPETDSYEPSDIVFSYKDIYAVQHSVSGDLRQHLVSNIVVPPPPTGTSLFEFYPKMNGQAYPTDGADEGNGYMAFQFASWSIVSSNPATTPTTVESHVECYLYDDSDNLVCKIIDKRGNYHPSFAPYFPSGTDLRSNNHLPQYKKYLPYGTYVMVVKNVSISPVVQKLRLGYQGTGGNGLEIINDVSITNVTAGDANTFELSFDLMPRLVSGSSNAMVLNFNVYTYP